MPAPMEDEELLEYLLPAHPTGPVLVQWVSRSTEMTINRRIMKLLGPGASPIDYRAVTFLGLRYPYHVDITSLLCDFARRNQIGHGRYFAYANRLSASPYSSCINHDYAFFHAHEDPDDFIICIGEKLYGRRGVLVPEMV